MVNKLKLICIVFILSIYPSQTIIGLEYHKDADFSDIFKGYEKFDHAPKLIDPLSADDLREISGSLVEVYSDTCIEKNGDVDDVFGIHLFVIGPNVEVERETFRRILAFYGLYFEPSHINDYIRKLSYQLYGLTYDWTDQHND